MSASPLSGSLVREVSRLFVRSQRAQTACVDGASNVQCHVLTELLRVDGITQQALVERLSLDKAWISRAVEALVGDGVVSKVTSELDKRSVKLSLTPLGRVRAEKLENALNHHAAQVFDLIPQDKHAQLEESLNILIAALRQNPFDAASREVSSASIQAPASELGCVDLVPRKAQTHDWQAIEHMLKQAGLPVEGALEHLHHFCVISKSDRIIALGGFELYGQVALLRSIVVDESARGANLGLQIVTHLRQQAKATGVHDLFLQTTNAQTYFEKLGFESIKRAEVPHAILASSQFQGACPASAHSMQLKIG
ncbi:GNAT family N-acetyltransferase [Undibacterium amnicola]|uniref:GNAT family N-acetyltransferase n=1 Tax=Undibacterium amnicola TaxID=1834038 RepID=A0ABR6XSZ2_9BURK|nr:arsenic resistance N-acetyltransferase ArsN2 [Undibacterium amnicola]MBC3832595.1 GNAT family N-acetyltransferase [Undibacterium amnicola]